MSCKVLLICRSCTVCLLGDPSKQLEKYSGEKRRKTFLLNLMLFKSSLPISLFKFLICLLQHCASAFSIHINKGIALWVCALKCYSPVEVSWNRSELDEAGCQGKTKEISHISQCSSALTRALPEDQDLAIPNWLAVLRNVQTWHLSWNQHAFC